MDYERPGVDETKAPKNAAEEIALIELKIKRAQLADLELQSRERELNLEDLRGRLGDRENKTKQRKLNRESQARSLAQERASDDAKQKACTHKKGGVVSARDLHVLHTGGNGSQYAVIKHIMINGDMWVRCLRCAKTWLPPVKDNFYLNAKGKVVAVKDGVFSSERFEQAQREYLKAMQFETNNSPSASVVCKFTKWDEKSEQWVDATTDYRIAVKNSNLR